MKALLHAILPAIAIAVAAAPLAAQDGTTAPAPAPAAPTSGVPAAEQFFESIEVNVVNIDVYVTDKKGQTVRGLGKDDFELLEDGIRMQITNFYTVEESAPGAAAPPAAVPPAAAPALTPQDVAALGPVPEDQRLHLIVYVDNWNIKPFDRNRVFAGLREFLRTRLTRDDRVMLVTYDRELHVRRPFTSDPLTIAAALFDVEKLSANGIRQDSERRDILREIKDADDANQATLLARNYADSVFNDLSFSIDALKNTVSSLAGLPGRKVILYVSSGLPLVAGEDVFHAIQEKFTDSASVLESRTYDTSRRFQELVASANANRITFYTLDAGGLRVSSSISAENQSSDISSFVDSVHWSNIQTSLRMMADETGGRAILNSNDPTVQLQRIGDDLRNYYSLGYSPAHSGDGRYHKVEVRVKGRKDLVVRNREGYRDKTVEARMSDGVMSSLVFDVESNPMGIVIQRGTERQRDDGYFLVPVEVRIPIGRLVMVEQGDNHVARVRVFVAAMDDKGQFSEVQQTPVPIQIPSSQVVTAMTKDFLYTVSLVMRRGPQKLAVGVRDDLGQANSFAVRTMNIGGG